MVESGVENALRGMSLELSVPPVYRDTPDLRTGKNIVVCADGTGNADIKGRGTNVFKLFEAVDTTTHLYDLAVPRQIAFYDEGVGTESWWPKRIIGGATGHGLARNVRHLYQGIARVYHPDDRLYLFGFSRGAFTVRTLAGLIDCCGIPKADQYPMNEDLANAITRCYEHYKLKAGSPNVDITLDVKCHPRRESSVEFLGVWDTVDAVGLPFKLADWLNQWFFRFKFDVHQLHASVRYACQALALDEPRRAFTPVLWDRADNAEQVWFTGAHSDVGGGYPRQGLSLISLHWMMQRAQSRGLRFVRSDEMNYDGHQILADKLHDPRSGYALYYSWKPRDVAALCTASGVDSHVHISVLDRIAQAVEGYAPINIPNSNVLTFTEKRDWMLLDPGEIQRAMTALGPELDAARRASGPVLRAGVQSYWLFALSTVLLISGAVWCGLAWSGVEGSTWTPPAVAVAGLVGLALAYILATATDRSLDGIYSRLWHRVRPALRDALSRRPSGAAPTTSISARISSPP